MKITEIFKSIDGEGIRTGKIVTFIRSFGCCCSCSYCDSRYSNEVTEGVTITDMTVYEIVNICKENKTPYVTFTGGEPLIQKDAFELIKTLCEKGFEVNIETSGAVDIKPFKDKLSRTSNTIFTVDYKSLSSGANHQMIMENFTNNLSYWDVVKFVVGTEDDLNDMKRMVEIIKKSYDSFIPNIFVSPIFGMIEPKNIVQYIIDNDLFDVRMQLQIHKYVWPIDMRGV